MAESFIENPLGMSALAVGQRAILIGMYPAGTPKDSCEESLRELERLAETFGLVIVEHCPCPYRKIEAATLLGSGKLEEIAQLLKTFDANCVLIDEQISPHQQRNLEKIFNVPVVDRTELIIDVFAQRAQTNEARLQIELAKIQYQFPRLKRLWTHLSRQSAGGGAYLKGEGEKQIELDRRMLKKRVQRLKEQIKEVSAHRATQRAQRRKVAVPTLAIVGYTNAGKSTLMKALTDAEILVEDKLFATLDTTTRKFELPNRQPILLIDTVGFIRKIPHGLVAAFKSTLEEAIHTDLLIHLIDVSHANALMQAETTLEVLKELGVDKQPIITVFNKIDLAPPLAITKLRVKFPRPVLISATTKEGLNDLQERIMEELANLRTRVTLKIPQSEYGFVAQIKRESNVIEEKYDENDVILDVELPKVLLSKAKPYILEDHTVPTDQNN